MWAEAGTDGPPAVAAATETSAAAAVQTNGATPVPQSVPGQRHARMKQRRPANPGSHIAKILADLRITCVGRAGAACSA